MLKICSFRKLRQSEEDIFDKITFLQIWDLEYKYELKWKIKFGKLVVGGAWGVGVWVCGVEIGWWKIEMIVFRFSLK